MPDKKLTNSEIVKVKELIKKLEEAYDNYYNSSKGMPYDMDTTLLDSAICFEHCLNEINRLQAENEKNENIIRLADKTIETQNAKIERLKAQCENTQIGYNFLKADFEELKADKIIAERKEKDARDLFKSTVGQLKTTKAEAYKECIEKVKEIMHKYCGEVTEDDLDNLLKELVVIQPPLNDVKCKDCEYLELELPYAVCSKAYKGIVAPDDSCGKGKLKELVGE